MRYLPCVAVLLLAALSLTAKEPKLLPIQLFAADDSLARARLSPDGRYIASLQDIDGQQALMLLDLQQMKHTRIDPGVTPSGLRKEIGSFRWISDRRISFMTTLFDGEVYTGLSAVDCDGKNWVAFTGPDVNPFGQSGVLATQIIHSFEDKEQTVLMVDRGLERGGDLVYPDVVRVSTLNGSVDLVVKNPGNVIRWIPDRSGAVRLGVTREGMKHGVTYRDTAASPWRTLPISSELQERKPVPLGFDYGGHRLLVAAENEYGRRGVYYYDLQTGSLGEAVASHRSFDIIPMNGDTAVDGVTLAGPVLSDLGETIIGIRFIAEGPRSFWIDPGFAALQEGLDKVLPETVNLIVSRTRDEKRFLLLAFSDRDPGTYYLIDRKESGQVDLTKLGALQEKFPVKDMAPMFPIKYTARDGEAIHGYLTLPLGEKRTDLPLIVMPHGGPFLRDSWQFNPDVQFLANRGYAVLQMNFRGSPGYGQAFLEKGKREIGRGMQNDIEDGVRWAIERKFADPDRIAIVGGSYGGFSALFALAHNPELYRCGVSLAGVTDWTDLSRERRGEEYKFAYLYFREWIGDPKLEPEFMASISPVNLASKITAPLFIVQGKNDRIVPVKQARKMEAAMAKAGRPAQVLYFSGEAHGLRREKNRIKYYAELEKFLATHLAPRK